jgi:hypothetical protein
MTDEYRVIVHGTGELSGEVASRPGTEAAMREGYPRVVDTFAADITAGNVRVELVTETEYQRRQRRRP